MNRATKRIFAIGLGAFVLGISLVGCTSNRANTPESTLTSGVQRETTFSDPATWIIGALAYLDLHGSSAPAGETQKLYATEFAGSPEQTMSAIEQRIALVPYNGLLIDPTRLSAGGTANTLDRAQLVTTILHSRGVETRIVFTDQDGSAAVARYATTALAAAPPPMPSVLEALQTEVRDTSPAVLAKLKSSGGNWGAGLTRAATERRLYWLQYRRANSWVDLVPSDMKIDGGKRLRAQVLSPEALAALQWRVNVAVTNSYSDGSTNQTVLTYSEEVSHLNGVPLTFVNQPDGSQNQFVPTLFYGNKIKSGTAFAANQDSHDLDHQLIVLDVVGPDDHRRFVRVLVGPKRSANDAERLLQIATLARVTVVTGFVSDQQLENAIVANLAQTSKLVFGTPDPKVNFTSASAIAVLDASHRAAGRAGTTASDVLAFQGRPAIALDHDFLAVTSSGLMRRHTFDLVDPGHSLYAPKVSQDELVQAAVEQSIADAWLEDKVAAGATVTTSRGAIHEIVTSSAPLRSQKQSRELAEDAYGNVSATYRLGSTSQGSVAGWRFDPGPQVVPILSDLSGGTEVSSGSMARVGTLCGRLITANLLVPVEVFPQKLLVGGLVQYDCKLAQTYVKAAKGLDIVSQQLSGNTPAPAASGEDLDSMIRGLGPDLLRDILLSALVQSGSGLVVHRALGESEEENAVIKYLLDTGAEATGEHFSDKIKEKLNEIEKSRAEGKSPGEIERQASEGFTMQWPGAH